MPIKSTHHISIPFTHRSRIVTKVVVNREDISDDDIDGFESEIVIEKNVSSSSCLVVLWL